MDSQSQNHGHGRKPPPPPQRIAADAPDMEVPHAQDHWRVNIAEAWEVAFWSREFGCSEAQLRKAVTEAGDTAGDVRAWLHRASDN